MKRRMLTKSDDVACTNCGTLVDDDDNYCKKCGKKLPAAKKSGNGNDAGKFLTMADLTKNAALVDRFNAKFDRVRRKVTGASNVPRRVQKHLDKAAAWDASAERAAEPWLSGQYRSFAADERRKAKRKERR